MTDYSQYFGDIERWIAEKGCVTYRGMACSLNISVNISKSALYQFLERKEPKMKSTVLTVGRGRSALFSFQFVTVDGFDGVNKLLGSAQEKHVYSLHCPDSSEHPHLAMQGQDFNQVEEATRGSSTLMAFTSNAIGLVHMAGIDSNVKKVRATSSATATKSQSISKPTTFSAGKKASGTASTSASEVSSKAKLASKANSFFGSTVKANEKKVAKDKKVSTETDTTSVVKEQDSAAKDAKKKTVVEEDWDEEESDDETATSASGLDKGKIKKRQISASAPQGTGGTHQSDVVLTEHEVDSASDDDDDEDTTSRKKKKKKADEEPKEIVVFKTHGAMDDFMEDAALKERERNKEAAAAGVPPKRVKRKKLVEKMFADEKGYLVTEMVMEEVSEDEAEEPAAETLKRSQSHPKPAPVAAKKPKPTPAAGKKGGAKSTGQQKSMMSFFGKK